MNRDDVGVLLLLGIVIGCLILLLLSTVGARGA